MRHGPATVGIAQKPLVSACASTLRVNHCSPAVSFAAFSTTFLPVTSTSDPASYSESFSRIVVSWMWA
jgi:hypothetical protein